jgi:membrane fusion protein, multidrug efflux system
MAARKHMPTYPHRLLLSGLSFGFLTLCGHAGLADEEAKTARGVIQALTEATVAVDYSAKVKRLPKLEGQSFKAGEVLVVFDCHKFAAEVVASRAASRAKELMMNNNRKLLSRGAIGANEVKISEAEFSAAQANISALQARTGSCNFKAPFDGLLVERFVQEHETPSANQPLIKIVDTTRLEIEAIVPSKWLGWLKPKQQFAFMVDETGAELAAEVVRLGAVVDPVSQTIKVYGVLKNKNSSILPGMSGTATFHSTGS